MLRRYYLTDHLGSVRAVVDGGGSTTLTRDYYPFGLPMDGRHDEGSPRTPEDFTGHERDAETQLHYAGARYYLSAYGRWNATDPLADDFPAWSPYNYTLNNPINLFDPDGQAPCPWCWGAVVGAGVEFGSQVTVLMNSGQSFGEAVRNVDYADVGIAAAPGAASGGLSTLKTVGTIGRTATAVTLSVGEGATKANVGTQTSDYGLTEAVLDAGVAGAGQRFADAAQSYAQGTRRGRQLQRTADRAERIHRNNPRPSRATRAREARAHADSYGGGPAARSARAGAQSAATGIVGPFVSGSDEGQGGSTAVIITVGGGGAPADNTRVIIRLPKPEEEER